MEQITGKDLINYIKNNKLEDAIVEVTGTIYHHGDHDCISTTDVSLMTGSTYDDAKNDYVQTVNIYIDDNLY